ncbi:hypothetical protein EHE22_26315 (plasmid) [Ochrobactrum pseudogrignonense]|uniref:Uncharacterized protein n=1 Tax=Brucella pseudogrignonensis TaxID=419475 RepID=A0A7Y3X031_9HYPH|nr:hypothetical protein [Brucella pseudogrignonensis]NNV23879.1 hypothetical protein [Brucella pseudogrignonensis]
MYALAFHFRGWCIAPRDYGRVISVSSLVSQPNWFAVRVRGMAEDRSLSAAIFRFACLGFVGFADARLIADLDFRDERKRECDGKFKLARTGQFRFAG